MPELTAFGWVFATWGLVSAVLVLLLIRHGLVAMKEDDQLFLNEAEHQLEDEQKQIVVKLHHLRPYIQGFAMASGVLFLTMAGMITYGVLQVIRE
jgi:hypothetical protein